MSVKLAPRSSRIAGIATETTAPSMKPSEEARIAAIRTMLRFEEAIDSEAIAPLYQGGARRGRGRLPAADQYAGQQHQEAAEDHLDRRRDEGRLHEAPARPGDDDEFDHHDDAGDRRGGP